MTNQIFDRDDRDPNREPDPIPHGYRVLTRADARALWSVRVLDAWADFWHTDSPQPQRQNDGTFVVVWLDEILGLVEEHERSGPTRDEARHAAALAVYPTLPADARAELGECP